MPFIFSKCHKSISLKKIEPKINLKCPLIEHKNQILEYVKENLPTWGIVKQREDGYIYAELPNYYIYDPYTLLNQNYAQLPNYFDENQPIGAHISLILPEENPTNSIDIGEKIQFSIKDLHCSCPHNLPDIKYIWYLTVECDTIVKIRKDNDLPAKIFNQEYHITFAIEKKVLNLEDIVAFNPFDQSLSIHPLNPFLGS
tara:strand:- start:132 stop:728 length:597 start_codon:yes stop_codon:yes gene_type:complete